MGRIRHYIGGKAVAGESGRRGDVFNPATGEKTHEVDFASTDEVVAAVSAAAAVAPAWRATSLAKRADVMFSVRQTLDAHRADIARAITAQHGKVLSDAMGEAARGVENLPPHSISYPHINPQTEPFFVEGAEPGDTLAVHFIDVRPARDWAVSTTVELFGALTGTAYTGDLAASAPRVGSATRM